MKSRAIVVTIFTLMPFSVMAEDNSICSALSAAYLKESDRLVLEQALDSTAVNQLKINTILMVQTGQLMQMTSYKCPLPQSPMTASPNPVKSAACAKALGEANVEIARKAGSVSPALREIEKLKLMAAARTPDACK